MVKLAGILNITPDSFYDGGKYNNIDSALSQLDNLIKSGADIIDIGAQSTRPGAIAISAQEEYDRLEEILPKIIEKVSQYNKENNKNIKTSIDSYHYQVIKKSHQLGVNIINDISGLVDQDIIKYIAKNNITTILMHNLSIHANPEIIINQHLDINREIIRWAQEKIKFLENFKISKSQLIFDPGIGFSKNSEQSIQILKNISSYKILNMPIYIGHSMKSFLDKVDIKGNRHEKTLQISKFLIENGVDYLRIHDVKSHNNLCQKPSLIEF